MKTYIGIDCGLDGGIVTLTGDGIVSKSVMPTISPGKGRKIDLGVLCDKARFWHLTMETESRLHVIVEDPGGHAPSASGLRSMTYSFAVAEMLLVAFAIPYTIVRAQTWQREFWKRPQLANGVEFDNKGAALAASRRIWPGEDWTKSERAKNPHDGIVDAALLAEWGRRGNL